MEIERETLVEAGVAVVGVAVFTAVTLVAGSMSADGGLTSTGALVLVGGIVAFVLAMSGLGFWLSTRG